VVLAMRRLDLGDGLASAADAELRINALQMGAHGGRRYEQLLSNLDGPQAL